MSLLYPWLTCLYIDRHLLSAEKYFEMTRKQCKQSLSIYKKFVLRMEEISKMLKVAEVLRETLSWHVYESTGNSSLYLCSLAC